jgi:hypothetical protein
MTVQLYLHRGWSCQDKKREVVVILEGKDPLHDDATKRFELAQTIAGNDYFLALSESINVDVPPPLRGVLLTLDELYEGVPELNPRRKRSRARNRS